ncbi:MAG: hypothetical protein ABSC05_37015 [Candidatus Solibacter sp.]
MATVALRNAWASVTNLPSGSDTISTYQIVPADLRLSLFTYRELTKWLQRANKA